MNIDNHKQLRISRGNSMRKQIAAMFATGLIAMLALMTPAPVQAIGIRGVSYTDTFKYSVYSIGSKKTAAIMGCKNTCPKNLVIPREIDPGLWGFFGRYPVTEIGKNAFKGADVASVTLPTSLQKIGARAFLDTMLKAVVLPDTITEIDDEAFSFTNGDGPLQSVTFKGSSLTKIGLNAFHGQSLKTVNFPRSLTQIGQGAFASNKLTSLVIPSKVSSIGEYAFALNQLTKVEFMGDAPEFGYGDVFEGNMRLTVILRPYLPSGVKTWPKAFGRIPVKIRNTKAWGGSGATISGNLRVGQTLTIGKGTWYGSPTPSFAYQWYACTQFSTVTNLPVNCTKIIGATKDRFKLTPKQFKQFIMVSVTGTSEGTLPTTNFTSTPPTWVTK
jgi:hypothetical protein